MNRLSIPDKFSGYTIRAQFSKRHSHDNRNTRTVSVQPDALSPYAVLYSFSAGTPSTKSNNVHITFVVSKSIATYIRGCCSPWIVSRMTQTMKSSPSMNSYVESIYILDCWSRTPAGIQDCGTQKGFGLRNAMRELFLKVGKLQRLWRIGSCTIFIVFCPLFCLQ